MITQNSIEQLLNVVNIEDVVGDFVALKRSGPRYKGCCPFHDEKTPSFVVSPSIGIYKCFGCQKGGNAIQFMMDIENLNFVEAAKSLAKRFGVELEETHVENQDAHQEAQRQRESIQAAVDFAQGFFVSQLFDGEEGKSIGLPYFKERGFTVETIKKWGLGYSPESWEALAGHSKVKGFHAEVMVQAGLLKLRDNGTHYDLFRHRVMFSIYSVTGKVIAFAGRKMSSTDPSPKYVNSPETELYKKSDVLFGLFQAKNAIKKADKVYMTEGYTDVITLSQAGIENVVASSGTALTPGQIKLLKRFTDNVTVVYDGDAAGIKASIRGIDLLLQDGLNVRVVSLPEGQDPDSFCQQLGGDAFQAYLNENEQTFIHFKAKLLIDESKHDPLKKSDAVREILRSVSLITDGLKRSTLTRDLSQICEMEESVLVQELGHLIRQQKAKEEQAFVSQIASITHEMGVGMPAPGEPAPTEHHQELAVFKLLLLYGNVALSEAGETVYTVMVEKVLNDPDLPFENDLAVRLISEAAQLEAWPEKEYFINHRDSEIAAWAAGVMADGHLLSKAFEDNYIDVSQPESNINEQVKNVILHLKRTKFDKTINAALELLKNPEITEEEMEEVLDYIKALNLRKKEIADELGNSVSWI
ncbi:MAG: DNA primase [Bacteroidia bacterium]